MASHHNTKNTGKGRRSYFGAWCSGMNRCVVVVERKHGKYLCILCYDPCGASGTTRCACFAIYYRAIDCTCCATYCARCAAAGCACFALYCCPDIASLHAALKMCIFCATIVPDRTRCAIYCTCCAIYSICCASTVPKQAVLLMQVHAVLLELNWKATTRYHTTVFFTGRGPTIYTITYTFHCFHY